MFLTRFGTLNQHYYLSNFYITQGNRILLYPWQSHKNSTSGIANMLCNLRSMLKNSILEKADEREVFSCRNNKSW